MIEVGSVLVHEDVVKQNFVCNLNKCKGACCLEGDSGAPLFRIHTDKSNGSVVEIVGIQSSTANDKDYSIITKQQYIIEQFFQSK